MWYHVAYLPRTHRHMGKRDKILRKARNNPRGLKFREACYLADAFGLVLDRQEGSHVLYVAEGLRRPVNLQDRGGMAKGYQVKQLLKALEDLGFIEPEE